MSRVNITSGSDFIILFFTAAKFNRFALGYAARDEQPSDTHCVGRVTWVTMIWCDLTGGSESMAAKV